MKAVRVLGPSEYIIEEVDIPSIRDNEVLLKVKQALICSSDVKLINGEFHGLSYPMTPGHEFSGQIVKVPEGLEEMIGKKAVADILIPCRKCSFCNEGKINLCKNLNEIGINKQGAFAEYVSVPIENLKLIDFDVNYKRAALVEPMAVALRVVNRIELKPYHKIAILGQGAVGLLCLSLLKASTYNTIDTIDFIQNRLDVSKRLGATNTHKRLKSDDFQIKELTGAYDIIIDATGSAEGFNIALELVKPGGQVGYVSYSGYEQTTIQPSVITLKELNVFGVLSPTSTWEQALEFIRLGFDNEEEIVTHSFCIDDFDKALELMKSRNDNVIRASIDFE